jgi:hypothetical protein
LAQPVLLAGEDAIVDLDRGPVLPRSRAGNAEVVVVACVCPAPLSP